MILHSPTERAPVISALMRQAQKLDIDVMSSSKPERMGVDFAWRAQGRWWGVQRKELQDFLASLNDGRLTLEIAQMNAAITMPVLVLEGRVQIANGNVMTNGYGQPVTLSGLHKRLLTIMSRDISLIQVTEVAHTASFVLDHYQWSQSEGHATAATRPKPAGDWGRPTNRDYQVHLLSGLPGVSTKTANAIIETLGFPIRLDATIQQLCSVPGIGPVMARRIIAAMNAE